MSKELEEIKGRLGHINKTPLEEALHTIAFNTQINGMNFGNELRTIEQALQRLESIENTNPSEALESLFRIGHNHRKDYINGKHKEDYKIVEQALLKLDFLEDAMDLPIDCFSIFKNRNNDEVTIMRKEIYEEYQENEEILKIIFEKNVDIEMIKLYNNYEDYCRGKEKYSIRKTLWLTEKEFKLIKKYCDKKGKGE